MNKTESVNIRFQKCDVYCGRGKGGNIPSEIGIYGWLGNPIKLNTNCNICGKIHEKGGDTLNCYEIYLRKKIKESIEWKEMFIKSCLNKKLGCFCKPRPCHTDIMIKVLNEIIQEN